MNATIQSRRGWILLYRMKLTTSPADMKLPALAKFRLGQ